MDLLRCAPRIAGTLLAAATLLPFVFASPAQAAPIVVAPAPGTELGAGAVEFTWSANGTAVDQWWVQIGRTAGGRSLVNAGPLPAATDRFTLVEVPQDGGSLHLRLWHREASAVWEYVDASWTVPGQAPLSPELTSPAAGGQLAGAAHEFTWNARGSAVAEWWLYVGTSKGTRNVFDSGVLDGALDRLEVTSLPVDGRTLHARLFYRATGEPWLHLDASFSAASLGAGVTLAPAAGAVLAPGAAVTWSGDASVAQWWLHVADSAGGSNLFDSGRLGSTVLSQPMPASLPTDGRNLYARLWYRTAGGSWQFLDRQYVATGQPVVPALTAPDGDVLGGGPQTFAWSDDAFDAWWLYVGTTLGGKDLHDSGLLPTGTRHVRVTGLPADGSTVFVRLWYRSGRGAWRYVDRSWLAPTQAPSLVDYELAFADEFDGSTLDPAKWNTGLLWGPYLPINQEEQLYVDSLGMHTDFSHDPFEVSNGTLKITASKVDDTLRPPVRPAQEDPVWGQYGEYRHNYPYVDDDGVEHPGYIEEDVNYLSGIITSYDAFKFARGYVEARAKLPAGRGLWPAFWALNAHYVEASPEIDVMEFLGQSPDRVFHTYHYFQPENNWAKISTPTFETLGEGWTTEFHTYGLEWSPKQLIWYVDGVETQRITDADYEISRQAMYLIANLAVGGSWPGAPDTSTVFPATYELDYIRAYRRVDPEPVDLDDFQLVFADDFDGESLDPAKWNTEYLWGPYFSINAERQYYVNTLNSDADKSYSPFEFADGILSIVARSAAESGDAAPPADAPGPDDPTWTENGGWAKPHDPLKPYTYVPGDYTSGLITSRDSFMFAYGYAEARVRIPEGDGLWPAFWLLNSYYIAQQPEIDIMEARGSRPFEVSHSYHRNGLDGVQHSTSFESRTADGEPTYSDAFHTYGVRWSPTKITWYIDGQPVHSIADGTVGYQLMYVLMNLAVGGNYPYKPVDEAALPARLQIDWIRVYQERELR